LQETCAASIESKVVLVYSPTLMNSDMLGDVHCVHVAVEVVQSAFNPVYVQAVIVPTGDMESASGNEKIPALLVTPMSAPAELAYAVFGSRTQLTFCPTVQPAPPEVHAVRPPSPAAIALADVTPLGKPVSDMHHASAFAIVFQSAMLPLLTAGQMGFGRATEASEYVALAISQPFETTTSKLNGPPTVLGVRVGVAPDPENVASSPR
jgi:hypothetical protein